MERRMAVRTVFLIGTNHFYQRPGSPEEFRTLLEVTCEEHDIALLAEEMSLDGLSGATASICKQVADVVGIPHVYGDPSREEQKKLGIAHPGRTGDPVADARRQQYWLAQILQQNSWPVLFICGGAHTMSFRELLQAHDIVVRVLFERWQRPQDEWL